MTNTARRGRLYDQVADRIARMIATGSLKPGERIPSIRRMSDQMSVAISTVLHAYQVLEDRGLIEARSQSGFYVRPKHSRRVADALSPLEPEMLLLPLRANSVRGDDAEFLRAQTVGTISSIALGMSLPSPEFLPIDTISKHLARAVRCEPEAACRYELSPGLKELRVRVAQRAMDCGCSLGPDDIVITNGTTEALALAMRAVTEPGDTVAVESPCYFGFLSLEHAVAESRRSQHGSSRRNLRRPSATWHTNRRGHAASRPMTHRAMSFSAAVSARRSHQAIELVGSPRAGGTVGSTISNARRRSQRQHLRMFS